MYSDQRVITQGAKNLEKRENFERNLKEEEQWKNTISSEARKAACLPEISRSGTEKRSGCGMCGSFGIGRALAPDWIAVQFPKMLKAFEEANAL